MAQSQLLVKASGLTFTLNAEVDEYDIQKVMMKGGEHLPKDYREIIEKELRAYVGITNENVVVQSNFDMKA